jgi:hypothetical protein
MSLSVSKQGKAGLFIACIIILSCNVDQVAGAAVSELHCLPQLPHQVRQSADGAARCA